MPSTPASASRREQRLPYIYLAPALLVLGVFGLLPVLFTVLMSLFRWDSIKGFGAITFGGLGNFVWIFVSDDWFGGALMNALWHTAVSGVLIHVSAIPLAAFIDRAFRRWRPAVMALYFLPYLTGGIVIYVIISTLFSSSETGLVNATLMALGNVKVFGLRPLAMFFPVERIEWFRLHWDGLGVMAAWWHGLGWNVLLYVTALQYVPRVLLEAARIDGANTWQALRYVIVPQLRPMIFFAASLTVVSGLSARGPVLPVQLHGVHGLQTRATTAPRRPWPWWCCCCSPALIYFLWSYVGGRPELPRSPDPGAPIDDGPPRITWGMRTWAWLRRTLDAPESRDAEHAARLPWHARHRVPDGHRPPPEPAARRRVDAAVVAQAAVVPRPAHGHGGVHLPRAVRGPAVDAVLAAVPGRREAAFPRRLRPAPRGAHRAGLLGGPGGEHAAGPGRHPRGQVRAAALPGRCDLRLGVALHHPLPLGARPGAVVHQLRGDVLRALAPVAAADVARGARPDARGAPALRPVAAGWPGARAPGDRGQLHDRRDREGLALRPDRRRQGMVAVLEPGELHDPVHAGRCGGAGHRLEAARQPQAQRGLRPPGGVVAPGGLAPLCAVRERREQHHAPAVHHAGVPGDDRIRPVRHAVRRPAAPLAGQPPVQLGRQAFLRPVPVALPGPRADPGLLGTEVQAFRAAQLRTVAVAVGPGGGHIGAAGVALVACARAAGAPLGAWPDARPPWRCRRGWRDERPFDGARLAAPHVPRLGRGRRAGDALPAVPDVRVRHPHRSVHHVGARAGVVRAGVGQQPARAAHAPAVLLAEPLDEPARGRGHGPAADAAVLDRGLRLRHAAIQGQGRALRAAALDLAAARLPGDDPASDADRLAGLARQRPRPGHPGRRQRAGDIPDAAVHRQGRLTRS